MALMILLLLGFGYFSQAMAQEEEAPAGKPAPYMLIVTVHTPPGHPDSRRMFPQKSLDSCWEQAKEFVQESEIPEGGFAISAACGKSIAAKNEEHPT